MKVVEIEGIRLTEEMISRLKYFQENEGTGVDGYTDELDTAVRLIASCSSGTPLGYENKALKVISSLCALRDILQSFSGKEVKPYETF